MTEHAPRRRRALVTGGAGFVGSHLTGALLERGDEVVVIDDLSTGRLENLKHLVPHPRLEVQVETISNERALERAMRGCDAVFHLAAAVGVDLVVRDPVRVIETNVTGTRAVLDAARRFGSRVLVTSSSEIYGKSEEVPFREESDRLLGPPTRARWSYSASKAIQEYLTLAYRRQGVPVVIARLFNTIGPRQRGRYGMVVPRLVRQCLRGEPLTVYGDGRQSRSFCDVRDVVAGLLALMDHPGATGEVFNLGSPRETSILDLARLILALAPRPDGASPAEIEFVPHERAYEPGFEDMFRRLPDVSKIRALTGWTASRSLEETLRDVIAAHPEGGGLD